MQNWKGFGDDKAQGHVLTICSTSLLLLWLCFSDTDHNMTITSGSMLMRRSNTEPWQQPWLGSSLCQVPLEIVPDAGKHVSEYIDVGISIPKLIKPPVYIQNMYILKTVSEQKWAETAKWEAFSHRHPFFIDGLTCYDFIFKINVCWYSCPHLAWFRYSIRIFTAHTLPPLLSTASWPLPTEWGSCPVWWSWRKSPCVERMRWV